MIGRTATARYRAMPTVSPGRSRLLGFGVWMLVWLCLFAGCMLIVLGTVGLTAKLHATQAQLDAAFMQGMQAGHQMCPRGVQP